MKNILSTFLLGICALSGFSSYSDEHFFVSFAPVGWKNIEVLDHSGDSREACERNLQKALCETTASTQEISRGWSRIECAPGSANYLPVVMKIHDELPEHLRPSLCSMNRIFISDRIPSIAFASPILKDMLTPPVGAYIGVRKSTFLNQPSSHDLVSWKEQLAFGGSKDFLANDPGLVQLNYGLKMSHLEQDGIFYAFVHEMGHLIDFNNDINASDCGRYGSLFRSGCHPKAATWGALSWTTLETPKKGAGYLQRENFCYYGCSGPGLAASLALPIYQSLRESAFLTTYSGVNSTEDFAEFWTWYLMNRFKDPQYRIVVPGQGELEMNSAFAENPKIAAKLRFIEKLWSSKDLKIINGR